MAVKITVDETRIKAFLKELPTAVNHKVMTDVNYQAAKIVVEKEKLLAPEGPTGNLVDSIGAVKMSYKNAQKVGEVLVGPRRKRPYRGFAGHLVEFGTRRRKTRKGANRGVMPKKPFAKPAFDQTKSRIPGAIAGALSKVVIKVMKKYKRL